MTQLRIKITMIKRWGSILAGKTAVAIKQDVGKAYSLNDIKGYYNDLTLKVGNGTDKDERGIPISLVGAGRHVHFPIAIFQYGLANYDLWLLNKTQDNYQTFKSTAEWAFRNQRNDGSWNCFGPIDSKKYTVSAMGQGEGASLLIRMYIETKEAQYLESAKKAIDFMLVPIEKGGTSHYEKDGSIILEEYAHKDRNTVLNGWIFAFFGLYDFIKVNIDSYYRTCLDKTITAMVRLLPSYDLGYWSKYDLTGKVASPAYHTLHIALLKVMYEITGNPAFNEYARKWEKASNSSFNKLRAIIIKAFQKIFEKTDAVVIR